MARRFPNRSNSGARPNRAWVGAFSVAQVNIPANSAVLISTFALSNAGIDETILRTVGSFFVGLDQIVANEQQLGAFGLILATDQAISVGITAIPDPITDINDDGWFVYVPIQQETQYATVVGQSMGRTYDFDSKAKRVVYTGTGVAVVVANSHATNGLDISVGFRMLSQVRGTR